MTRTSLCLLLLLATPALALDPAETVQGVFQTAEGPRPVSLVASPDARAWGGVLVLGAGETQELRRLILTRGEQGWELRVRRQVPDVGDFHGTLNEVGRIRQEEPRWRWSEPEVIPLQADGQGLTGGGFTLQDPLAERPLDRELGQEEPHAARGHTLVIGHRGRPREFCENTLPSLQAAAEAGADGVEIDLCLTRDDQVVIYHDPTPGNLVALVRNLGFEGGMKYMPNFPALGSRWRRPVHELSLEELRAHYGYSPRRFTLTDLDPDPDQHIASLAEAAPLLGSAFKLVFLDIKLPELKLVDRFARALTPILEQNGLVGHVILLAPETEMVQALQAALGPQYPVAHDMVIGRLFGGGDPDDYSAVASAVELGSSVASVGRPRTMLWGAWKLYSAVLRRDRARIDAGHLPIRQVAWTLNDEDELREVVQIGVDAVLTDDTPLLRRLIDGSAPASGPPRALALPAVVGPAGGGR